MKRLVRIFLFSTAAMHICAAQLEFRSYWKIGEDYFFSIRNGDRMAVISSPGGKAKIPDMEFVSFDEENKVLTVMRGGKTETLSIKEADRPGKFVYEPSNPEIAKLIKHGKISSQIILNSQTGLISYKVETGEMRGEIIIITGENGRVQSETFVSTDGHGNIRLIPEDRSRSTIKEEKYHPFSDDVPVENRTLEMPGTINMAPNAVSQPESGGHNAPASEDMRPGQVFQAPQIVSPKK